MTDVRKNLTVLAFILSGVLVSILILNFRGFEKNQKAQILETGDNFKNLPVKISKGLVNSFDFKGGSNKTIFYEKIDSMVYESGLDGKDKKGLARIPGASEMLFSPSGKELIATIKGMSNLEKTYFNLGNNQKIKLDKRIKSAAFSPDGEKLAYYFYDDLAGEGNISISNPDGSDFINIFKTRSRDLKLIWPENSLIVFYTTTEDSKTLSFSIKPDGKEFRKVSEDEFIIYSSEKLREEITNLGLEASDIKLSPLKDYLIFINAKDGKLYSLRI